MFKFRNNTQKGRQRVDDHAAVVTYGFNDDDPTTMLLHYTERLQPDRGGALNYSYDMLSLPLQDIVGPFVAYGEGFRTVTPPTAFFQQAPATGMGGTFTGTFAFQPLLDPDNPYGYSVNDI